MSIKSKKEIEIMREGGRILASVLGKLASGAIPGAKLADLDELANTLVRKRGGVPSFKGYQPAGATRPYPASMCVSLNDEVVHGLPGERTIKDGDIVSLDLGVFYKGFHTDAALTVIAGLPAQAGKTDWEIQSLVSATERILEIAIESIRPGAHIGDIGHTIESHAREHGYSVIKSLTGHGIGRAIHEEPDVPNFGKLGTGEELVESMTFAVEPMITTGSGGVFLDEDGFTYKTTDGSPVTHFEHTVVVTADGADILTRL